jgi:hypothetical protein
MDDTSRNYQAVTWEEINGTTFEVNQLSSLYNVKELIVVFMLVPVVSTKRLVVPLVFACVGKHLRSAAE